MGWSRVIKSINGHSYVYEQRTWREGRRVRADSRFVGKEGRGWGLLFHGSRHGLQGRPRPSDNATYGPGFYLTSRAGAELYARFEPDSIPFVEAQSGHYRGTVHIYNGDELFLLVLKDLGTYRRLALGLVGPADAALDQAKLGLQELWKRQGYDGLRVLDPNKPAVVVFPSSIHKLGDAVASYRVD